MTEYKRLTTRFGVGIGLTETSGDIVNDYEKVGTRLAELEDKIEQGTLKEIPENAVVLTEQEQNKILKATEKRIDQLKKQVELTRKETAKEILTYLWKQRNVIGQLMILEEDLIELAKQYGVEV